MLSLLLTSCGNNRINRLDNSGLCDPEADLASFELLEDEEEIFELVPGGQLPAGQEFEATGFTLTKIDGAITSSYNPINLYGDEEGFTVVCSNGFVLGQDTTGSFNFVVPLLNSAQELNQYDYAVDYDTTRGELGEEVFNTETPPALTPVGGVDILAELVNLGYEVNLYTFSSGDQQNVVFTAHARILAEGITLRIRIAEVEDDN